MAEGPARQLLLDIGRPASYDAEDFLVSPSNAEAHALVERWPDWPARTLLLLGPVGAGKTHLAAIWAARADARWLRPGDDLRALASRDRVVVEDGDRAGHAEADLFHLVNSVMQTDGWLLVTARTAPNQWNLATADLLSRLRLAPVTAIGRPDGDLIRSVIIKLFADRQILIAEDVVAYAALHCEQSLEAVSRFVAAVDEDALAAGRRITRPLAARTLARLTDENPALDA